MKEKRRPGLVSILFKDRWNFQAVKVAGFFCLILLITSTAEPVNQKPESLLITTAEARKIIANGNIKWGKARTEFDKRTFEKMLAPEFYAQLPNRKLTRKQFIDAISLSRPGVKLIRFDASVLTVQKTADGWVAIIHEKLEHQTPDGMVYSLWITRDGWRKTENQWVITFSEAIGFERWRNGEKPPFQDWRSIPANED